ncbi:TetR family transcriptional regulator [Amycolatopsis jiangsuensis]|uniref:AcrR family transcriptional regulator n=1 Tax=Amycolatopsis jiangsuensis TaxID=1181879 RepID=A0A840IKY9_9PSEU|nr:TetR family transcriptional regulator [Amycolatopsis jiangsuensis]MBB4682613.1 AcrR family transcriptional regulator [Amycolatopsis jiangsuensis]
MPERKPRKDAVRNRAAVLAAADALFVARESTEEITMADVAAAAGVGKGTLFRAFGDRTGLIRALYESRLEPLVEAVETGPPPLGAAAPPRDRVPALLDALLCFKLDNRGLMLALEGTDSASPYTAANYDWCHTLLRTLLSRISGVTHSDFTAHALLAAVRADLVEHLAAHEGQSRETMRADLAGFVSQVLDSRPLPR